MGGPTDLQDPKVAHVEVWVQLHGVPPEILSLEGILMLVRHMGTSMTDVRETYTNETRYMKVRILIPIESSLNDMITTKHLTSGRIVVSLVYERL